MRKTTNQMFEELEKKVSAYVSDLLTEVSDSDLVVPDSEGKGLHPVLGKEGPDNFDLVFGTRTDDKVFQGEISYEWDRDGSDLIKQETEGGKKLTRKQYLKLRAARAETSTTTPNEVEQETIEPTDEYKLMDSTALENGFKLLTPGTVIQPVAEYELSGKDIKLQIAVNDDYKFPGNNKWLLVGKIDNESNKKTGTTVAELSHALKELSKDAAPEKEVEESVETPGHKFLTVQQCRDAAQRAAKERGVSVQELIALSKKEQEEEWEAMKNNEKEIEVPASDNAPVDKQPSGKKVALLELVEKIGLKHLRDQTGCHIFGVPGMPLHEIHIPKKPVNGQYRFAHVRIGSLDRLPKYLRTLKGK